MNDTHSDFSDCDSVEEALNYYVDGELPSNYQSALFHHLASCDDCRKTFEAILVFRRMSRQEKISVPPALDDAVMERLAHQKRRNSLVDRRVDRNPLWETRKPVSVGVALVACIGIFLAGMIISEHGDTAVASDGTPTAVIEGIEEVVDFSRPQFQTRDAIYVFYPGVTIEGEKLDDQDPLANR